MIAAPFAVAGAGGGLFVFALLGMGLKVQSKDGLDGYLLDLSLLLKKWRNRNIPGQNDPKCLNFSTRPSDIFLFFLNKYIYI